MKIKGVTKSEFRAAVIGFILIMAGLVYYRYDFNTARIITATGMTFLLIANVSRGIRGLRGKPADENAPRDEQPG